MGKIFQFNTKAETVNSRNDPVTALKQPLYIEIRG